MNTLTLRFDSINQNSSRYNKKKSFKKSVIKYRTIQKHIHAPHQTLHTIFFCSKLITTHEDAHTIYQIYSIEHCKQISHRQERTLCFDKKKFWSNWNSKMILLWWIFLFMNLFLIFISSSNNQRLFGTKKFHFWITIYWPGWKQRLYCNVDHFSCLRRLSLRHTKKLAIHTNLLKAKLDQTIWKVVRLGTKTVAILLFLFQFCQ